MISVSRLLCDTAGYGDGLRYVPSARSQVAGTREGAGPVVVWNVTPACNLRCSHCYYDAGPAGEGGLDTEEALTLLGDLAAFRVPVVLFSGGEPLLRPDLPRLIARAVELGVRAVISTNGTLITRQRAAALRDLGVSYVGVSLDGVGEANDRMRGVPRAFAMALEGIRNCLAVGQRVGLRFTMTRGNVHQLDAIFDLITREGIPRACFYHLVYSGRGADMVDQDLDPRERRRAVDLIATRTLELHGRGQPVEILTVDNHADGPYLYLWALRYRPERASAVLELLRRNGGNRSGVAIAAIDHRGYVYPDQFSRHWPVGNVREHPFSRIWADGNPPDSIPPDAIPADGIPPGATPADAIPAGATTPDGIPAGSGSPNAVESSGSHPHSGSPNAGRVLLLQLRERKALLRGRCRRCAWLEVCNGNFRARAEAAGDLWGDDPACYLSDEEIAWPGGLERWTA